MAKKITIAGSNSQKSINKNLLIHVSSLLKNVEFISIDLNDFVLPIYGVDYEAENGIPTAVKMLDESFNETDGFIISLAEHNGFYAAVFKNTIYWLSRVNIKIWREKPILLMATSPGARGGKTFLQSAKVYFPYLGGNVTTVFLLPNFYDNFSEDGISDDGLNEELSRKTQLFYQHLN